MTIVSWECTPSKVIGALGTPFRFQNQKQLLNLVGLYLPSPSPSWKVPPSSVLSLPANPL